MVHRKSCKEGKEIAKELGKSVNQLLEEQYKEKMASFDLCEDEPTGMLVLPHFAGAATPYMDTGSKGAILGLTTNTSPCEIYMACLEGVCYEMFLLYERLKDTGISFKKFNATGGGANSSVWMQMKTDMLGIPFTSLRTVDAGTVGCAMLKEIAIGAFKDIDDAVAHMVEETGTYMPRMEQHEKYMKIFERYAKLYEAVRPLI